MQAPVRFSVLLVATFLVVSFAVEVSRAHAQDADTVTVVQTDDEVQRQAGEKETQKRQDRARAGFFAQGNKRGGVIVGLGNSFGNSYFVLGLGAGYYVINGLEVGLDFEAWWGATPNIYRLTPSIRYVFWQLSRVQPYAGLFYRRSFIDDLDDKNSWGGRAGIFYRSGRRTYVGVGVVWEKFSDCTGDCTNTYPEFVAAFGF
jgi:hypothetical protein